MLDPFLGSGTTVKAALELNRNVIGYELNEDFHDIIRDKVGLKDSQSHLPKTHIWKKSEAAVQNQVLDYWPRIQNSQREKDHGKQ